MQLGLQVPAPLCSLSSWDTTCKGARRPKWQQGADELLDISGYGTPAHMRRSIVYACLGLGLENSQDKALIRSYGAWASNHAEIGRELLGSLPQGCG